MQDKANGALPYPIVDSGQTQCYDAAVEIAAPAKGADFYGQDAQHQGNQPSYTTPWVYNWLGEPWKA